MYINNPPVPHCSPIGSPLNVGSLIKVSGHSSPSAACFAINLQCGPSVNPRDDVALHLSPVFTPPQRIVRNSIVSNNWGPEESFGSFPTSAGSSFEFIILVESSEFKIALNGSHFTEFRHRIPFERITHIAIDGEVTINTLSVSNESQIFASASAPPLDMPLGHTPYPPVGGLGPPYSGSNVGGAPYPGSNPGNAPYPNLGFEVPPPDTSYGAPYIPASSNPYPQSNVYPPLNTQTNYDYQPYAPPPINVPGSGYPAPSAAYPAQGSAYPTHGSAYPAPSAYPSSAYPSHTPGAVPNPYYPGQNIPPPPPGYQEKKGIGNMIGTAIAGVTGGAAAGGLGAKLLGGVMGNKHHHSYPHSHGHGPGHGHGHGPGHKSSSIPIGKIAAGAGAAALGAAVLGGINPLKKAKKMFKHKHKFGMHHRGWGSSSSSSSSSEEE